MERAPVVATVIPCYQEAACIERCLSSLIGQTHPSHAHQIIVLDGGSTDGTQDMVERLARHSAEIGGPRIELHHNL
ncbi:MAG TPA: glycosyltransferase, partial [Candidatus Poseidoniales archaeon]|nr:glycosyltransferase [Candidatus Poseidoniales archaeon]